MIFEMLLRFGRTPEAAPTPIALTPVTVFVGPNNSGKSKVLSEIDEYCSSGPQSHAVLLSSLSFEELSEARADALLAKISVPPSPGEAVGVGQTVLHSRRGRMHVSNSDIQRVMKKPASNLVAFSQWFLRHVVLKLDGQSRIGLVNSQGAGDLQQPPNTSFQVLFRDNLKRLEVRRIVKEAFGVYFVMDATNIGQFRIRLSRRPPVDEMEERGLHEAAVRFQAEAQEISVASDGVKAFTGIITEVVAGDPKILLIDEPEAFLHPSLAFKLGYELSRASTDPDKRIFVSTHSPNVCHGMHSVGITRQYYPADLQGCCGNRADAPQRRPTQINAKSAASLYGRFERPIL